METTKLASTIRNLEKENVSIIEQKENMEKISNELQRYIADHDNRIVNLWKLLSKTEDNLKEEMLECNFADHEIASLCTSFTEANNKLMKAVSENDDLE